MADRNAFFFIESERSVYIFVLKTEIYEKS